jgi:hypothetical protein
MNIVPGGRIHAGGFAFAFAFAGGFGFGFGFAFVVFVVVVVVVVAPVSRAVPDANTGATRVASSRASDRASRAIRTRAPSVFPQPIAPSVVVASFARSASIVARASRSRPRTSSVAPRARANATHRATSSSITARASTRSSTIRRRGVPHADAPFESARAGSRRFVDRFFASRGSA